MGLFDAIAGSYIDYTAETHTPRGSLLDALGQANLPSDARQISALRQLEAIHGEMLKSGANIGKRAAAFEAGKQAQVAAIMRSAGKEGGAAAKKMLLSSQTANRAVGDQIASDANRESLNTWANLQNIKKKRAHMAALIKGAGEIAAFGASKLGDDKEVPYGADYDKATQKELMAMKGLYSGTGPTVGEAGPWNPVKAQWSPVQPARNQHATEEDTLADFDRFFEDYGKSSTSWERENANWVPALRSRAGKRRYAGEGSGTVEGVF